MLSAVGCSVASWRSWSSIGRPPMDSFQATLFVRPPRRGPIFESHTDHEPALRAVVLPRGLVEGEPSHEPAFAREPVYGPFPTRGSEVYVRSENYEASALRTVEPRE